MNTTNITRAARLGRLRSHQRLNEVAAGACVADWPTADTWEAEALTQGRWVAGDPQQQARHDAADAISEAWESAPLSYGGDFRDYQGSRVEVPYGPGGRCRVVLDRFAMATVCDEPQSDDLEDW